MSATKVFPTLLLLGVICFAQASVPGCPSACHCRITENTKVSLDCSGSGLQIVPDLSGIETPIHRLDASLNRIQTIPSDFLPPGLVRANISEIILDDNEISEIAAQAFSGLANIQRISLRRNKMSRVKSQTFKEVSGQCTREDDEGCGVDLTENPVESIEANAFAFMRNINLLLGKANEEMTIAAYAFYGVRNIPSIHIKDVPSLVLQTGAFTNSERVTHFEVSNTTFKTIASFTFQGITDVEVIHIHHCNLPVIEDFGFAGVQYRPNVEVSSAMSAQGQGEGQSGNVITAQPSGGVVRLDSCLIRTLPADCFRDTNLARVHIKNNTIKNFGGFFLRGMSGVKMVELEDNVIDSLPADSLGAVSGINQLHLTLNNIKVIHGYAFRGLQEAGALNILLRAGSHLILDSNAFTGAYDITNVKIVGEGVPKPPPTMTVSTDAFANLVGVRNLDIINVGLPVLKDHTFRGMGKVHTLRFVSCNITVIESKTFGPGHYGPGAVDSLDLSQGNNLVCDCTTAKLLQEFEDVFRNVTLTCRGAGGVQQTTTYSARKLDTKWPVCRETMSGANQGPAPARGSTLGLVLCLIGLYGVGCLFQR